MNEIANVIARAALKRFEWGIGIDKETLVKVKEGEHKYAVWKSGGQWKIARREAKIGRGGFGKVESFRWIDENAFVYALKTAYVPKENETTYSYNIEDAIEVLKRENDILKKINSETKNYGFSYVGLQESGHKAIEIAKGKKITYGYFGKLYDGDSYNYFVKNTNENNDFDPDIEKIRKERRKKLTAKQSLHMLQEILHGGAVLHHLGMLHTDIKPQNLFLMQPTKPDGYYQLKIGDFGGVISINEKSSFPTLMPTYTFFKDWKDIQNAQSFDEAKKILRQITVFQLAASFCQMVTGKLPYSAQKVENEEYAGTLNLGSIEKEMLSKGIPQEVINLLKRCLGERNKRPSAEEAWNSLHKIIKKKPPFADLYKYWIDQHATATNGMYNSLYPTKRGLPTKALAHSKMLSEWNTHLDKGIKNTKEPLEKSRFILKKYICSEMTEKFNIIIKELKKEKNPIKREELEKHLKSLITIQEKEKEQLNLTCSYNLKKEVRKRFIHKKLHLLDLYQQSDPRFSQQLKPLYERQNQLLEREARLASIGLKSYAERVEKEIVSLLKEIRDLREHIKENKTVESCKIEESIESKKRALEDELSNINESFQEKSKTIKNMAKETWSELNQIIGTKPELSGLRQQWIDQFVNVTAIDKKYVNLRVEEMNLPPDVAEHLKKLIKKENWLKGFIRRAKESFKEKYYTFLQQKNSRMMKTFKEVIAELKNEKKLERKEKIKKHLRALKTLQNEETKQLKKLKKDPYNLKKEVRKQEIHQKLKLPGLYQQSNPLFSQQLKPFYKHQNQLLKMEASFTTIGWTAHAKRVEQEIVFLQNKINEYKNQIKEKKDINIKTIKKMIQDRESKLKNDLSKIKEPIQDTMETLKALSINKNIEELKELSYPLESFEEMASPEEDPEFYNDLIINLLDGLKEIIESISKENKEIITQLKEAEKTLGSFLKKIEV